MPITRTEAELKSAVETMFRVRAVESPPDEDGSRTIWHRGSKGADLITWVDAFGRVTRQELYLFDDCLVWEKTSGVRTGAAEKREGSASAPAPDAIHFDTAADDVRLGRVRTALKFYSGLDKFILHAQQLLGIAPAPAVAQPVTRPSFSQDFVEAALAKVDAQKSPLAPKPNRTLVWILIGAGLLLVALGIAIVALH